MVCHNSFHIADQAATRMFACSTCGGDIRKPRGTLRLGVDLEGFPPDGDAPD